MKEHYSKDKAVETVLRFGKVLGFGHDDLTALKKLGSWPSESLSKLSNIFKLFESFQTEDAKYIAKRQSSKIMKGCTIAVPNNLIRKVGKMTADYMDEVAVKITGKQLSLKQAAENFSKLSSRDVTMASVVKQMTGSGYRTQQEIVQAFPAKFTVEVLDSFAGSVIGVKGMNSKGKALQDYCKGVVANEDATPRSIMKEIKNVQDVDLKTLSGFETVVFNCRKLTQLQVQQLEALKADHISTNFILLFCEEDEKREAFNQLKTGLVNLREIYFEADQPIRKGDHCQNLKLGIISAPIVFKPPVKSFNGPLSNLDNLVNQITPPGGKNVFINEGNLQITAIHSAFSCEYFGEKSALDMLDKKLRTGTDILKDVTGSEINEIEENPNETLEIGNQNSFFGEKSALEMLDKNLRTGTDNLKDVTGSETNEIEENLNETLEIGDRNSFFGEKSALDMLGKKLKTGTDNLKDVTGSETKEIEEDLNETLENDNRNSFDDSAISGCGSKSWNEELDEAAQGLSDSE